MQEFIRTVDTTEAFKFKISALENELTFSEAELKEKQKLLKGKVSEFDANLNWGTGTASAANFHRGFGIFCLILSFVLSIVSLYLYSQQSSSSVILSFMIFVVLNLLFGFRSLSKVKPLRVQAHDMQLNTEQKRQRLKAEIGGLEAEIKKLTDRVELQRIRIDETRSKYMQHMVNQQDLLDKEISAIHTASSVQEDSKECPQCAEIIKARAKVCRFCNYRFD